MKQRVLITGITGFVGSHLAESLLDRPGLEVHGIMRWRSKTDNIERFKHRLRLHDCDLRDASAVTQVVMEVRPRKIFHLAAQSFVHASWLAPSETLATNVLGEVNLLEAVRRHCPRAAVQIAGSSEEYGMVHPSEVPIGEQNPLRPLSPYGVSKVAQDLLAYQYVQSYGMRLIRTRAFNTTGPRRGEVFAESNFAKQLVEIEQGLKPPIVKVGNLSAKRDYTDVRDMVVAYRLVLEKGKSGEVYNICSGRSYSMRSVLNIMLNQIHAKVKIQRDPARIRPSDVSVLHGDNRKLVRLTGWKPRISLEQSLSDLLAYWRSAIPMARAKRR